MQTSDWGQLPHTETKSCLLQTQILAPVIKMVSLKMKAHTNKSNLF